MKRESLIKSKDYLISQIQLSLLNLIGNYRDRKKLKDYQLAHELGVSKGYVSQLLNATFDHKISKVVDLALACNTVPLIFFEDIDRFVENDANDKVYELVPVLRPKSMTFTPSFNNPKAVTFVVYKTTNVELDKNDINQKVENTWPFKSLQA